MPTMATPAVTAGGLAADDRQWPCRSVARSDAFVHSDTAAGAHAVPLGADGAVRSDDRADPAMADSTDGAQAYLHSAHDAVAPPRNGAPGSDILSALGVRSGAHDGACGAGRGARLDADGDHALAGSTALGGPAVNTRVRDGGAHQRSGGRNIPACPELAVNC